MTQNNPDRDARLLPTGPAAVAANLTAALGKLSICFAPLMQKRPALQGLCCFFSDERHAIISARRRQVD
jgi:hypothetical protein